MCWIQISFNVHTAKVQTETKQYSPRHTYIYIIIINIPCTAIEWHTEATQKKKKTTKKRNKTADARNVQGIHLSHYLLYYIYNSFHISFLRLIDVHVWIYMYVSKSVCTYACEYAYLSPIVFTFIQLTTSHLLYEQRLFWFMHT